MADTVAIRFRAFLSYAHADTAWATWLHAALEGFHIDKDLVGRATPLGPVPKTLRPIFRDREDFSGGYTLTDATIAALDASSTLIVLCSAVAAARPAVNEEVRLFRSRHPERPVIPVIVEGEWPENVPPALRYEIAPDGTVTDRPVTFLCPDLRKSGDGKNLGLAKAVAGLIGVGSDDIVGRAERARRRRNRVWAALTGAFLMLAVGATGSAVYAWHQLKTNEALLDRTLKRATDLVNTAVAQAEQYGVSRVLTLKLLEQAEGVFDDVAELGRETPQLRFRRAWMLIAFARNYETLGDTSKQSVRAAEAHRLLALLASERPDDVPYQRELSVAYANVGDVLVAQGNLAGALKTFRDALAISERLINAYPNNALWTSDFAVSSMKLGDVLLAQGNLTEALPAFHTTLGIFERLAQADPSDMLWRRNLSASYVKVGAVLEAEGKLTEALHAFRNSLAIADQFAKADPNNIGSQRGLAAAHERIGDILLTQGHLGEALEAFRNTLAISERLVRADPSNIGRQHDLSVSYGKVGDVLLAQGKLSEALWYFRDDLTCIERLAKADANNTQWQRSLSIAYHRVGDVLLALGHPGEALKYSRDALAIFERLAKADPSNTAWRRDLSASYDRIGGMLVAQGNLTEALHMFRNSLAIAEQLAKSDPSNAGWQRDLAVSYSNIGGALGRQGYVSEAMTYFHANHEIRERLAKADPSNAQWQWDVVVSHARLATHGDEPARRWAFIVTELRKLRDENRLRPDWARSLPRAEEQLAKYEEAQPAATSP